MLQCIHMFCQKNAVSVICFHLVHVKVALKYPPQSRNGNTMYSIVSGDRFQLNPSSSSCSIDAKKLEKSVSCNTHLPKYKVQYETEAKNCKECTRVLVSFVSWYACFRRSWVENKYLVTFCRIVFHSHAEFRRYFSDGAEDRKENQAWEMSEPIFWPHVLTDTSANNNSQEEADVEGHRN